MDRSVMADNFTWLILSKKKPDCTEKEFAKNRKDLLVMTKKTKKGRKSFSKHDSRGWIEFSRKKIKVCVPITSMQRRFSFYFLSCLFRKPLFICLVQRSFQSLRIESKNRVQSSWTTFRTGQYRPNIRQKTIIA